MHEADESACIGHEPCPNCGSRDNLGRYSDGHGFCFGCSHYEPGDGSTPMTRRPRMAEGLIEGEVQALPKRGINEETCRKFGYRVGFGRQGARVQIAEYRDAAGDVVAQHTRTAGKDFAWIGDAKAVTLFGQHLWRGTGRRIVVTEGEIDAMSVAQSFGLTWDVVSLPNGAQSAKKSLQKSLEFLEGYETVVLWFDDDEPGREAVADCAGLFTPGRCSVAAITPGCKDANDVLLKHGIKAVTQAVYNAKPFRPGGIVNGSELWDRMRSRQTPGIAYPWAGLTDLTGGQKPGTLITWTSGTGQGKSTAVAQVAYDRAFPTDPDQEPVNVGYVALEEDVGQAALRFVSHRLGKLAHVDGAVSEEEVRKAFDETLATGRVWLHDHFGSTDSDGLISKLRYLAKGCGCQVIILDHLSIVVSGMGLDGDERRTIDRTMTMLRTLCEETGVIMHLVSHLKRGSDDKGPEEGGRVTLAMLRGSQAIAQLSDQVIGIERDQQAGGPMTFRLLKNRATGRTGPACQVDYDRATGKLAEVAGEGMEVDESDSPPF